VSDPAAGLAAYIAGALGRVLPADVERAARQHTLDTLAAIVSGSTLPPGVLARRYVDDQASSGSSTVVGSPATSTAPAAAFANGMSAHADECDDSHERAMAHLGCSVVPAALAVAERVDASLSQLLGAVALGYDVGARMMLAIGTENIRPWEGIWCSHALAGGFGSAAASSSLLGASEEEVRSVLSFAAQQTAGLGTAFRDEHHIEKAFAFAGMPARNGVTAAEIVSLGFRGVADPFSGSPNFFDLYPGDSDPQQLTSELGERFEVCATNIKRYPVGSPAQSALQALTGLLATGVAAGDVERLEVTIPAYVVPIVQGSAMPDICLEYLCAVTLLDGDCTFVAAHDGDRMQAPEVRALMERVVVSGDASMGRSRQARLRVALSDRSVREEHVFGARGTVHDPMGNEELLAKASSLMAWVLGEDVAQRCMGILDEGAGTDPVRGLGTLLRSAAA
jgi:2-methylcitrate dehydratase PrpD